MLRAVRVVSEPVAPAEISPGPETTIATDAPLTAFPFASLTLK